MQIILFGIASEVFTILELIDLIVGLTLFIFHIAICDIIMV